MVDSDSNAASSVVQMGSPSTSPPPALPDGSSPPTQPGGSSSSTAGAVTIPEHMVTKKPEAYVQDYVNKSTDDNTFLRNLLKGETSQSGGTRGSSVLLKNYWAIGS